ncbi:MAG: S-layer homology domain-containing protein, partial [Clostridia bacterium]|nr:S-layer homology domain-containing protein [Clostridia bacterium]
MKKILVVLMAVVMLAMGANAAFEKVNTYENNFTDVTENNWFFDNVKTAYELGFMNGKADGIFDPNGSVTVVEGITMASRLHAIYNDTEVPDKVMNDKELRFDFDDDSMIDTSGDHGNRTKVGITFGHFDGEFDNGVLVLYNGQPNAGGAFDPQVMFNKFNLDSRDYDTLKVRMRVPERLPEVVEGAEEKRWIQFYFATSTAPGYGSDKLLMATWPEDADETQWFELTLDLGKNPNWKDIVTSFRFDPPENNGIYEIDYIVLSKNQENKTIKWYDKYLDYAIKNSIMDDSQYYAEDYNKNITRAQLCEMIARAIPEEHFNAINDVKGIPDVLRDSRNSDVYLMLYKAGILLGSDEEGSFKPDSDIKRSEVAAIINRVALPENRVKGSIAYDWEKQGNEYDIEFNDDSWLERLSFEANGTEIKDGALVLKALDKGEGQPSRYDSKIIFKDINLDAAQNTKMRIRFKVDFIGEPENKIFDFYFATDEDPTFTESKSIHADMIASSYKDAAGWYVLEVDLATKAQWKGHIVSYRFDPTNTNGIFTIDYIRFVKADPLLDATHEELLGMGYTATGLLQDPDFERGFYIAASDN